MALAMTDAIAMTQADGFTGRNTARDIRTQWLGSQWLPDSAGYGVRPGVIPRTYIAVVGFEYVDLKVIQLDTPGVGVKLYPGKCIIARTGQGPYVLSQETTVTSYPFDNADPSNPRIDVLYARLYDQTIGDTVLHGPYLEHVNGTPAGSPTVPSVPAGALPLAQILRPAATNNVVAANITDVRKGTALAGAPRILLPGDSLSDVGIFPSERRLRIANPTAIAAGTAPFIEEIWTSDSKWRPVRTGVVGRNQRTTAVNTTATTAATAFRVFTAIAQVQAGNTYEICFQGELRNTAAPSTAQVDFHYTTNGVEPTVTDTQLTRAIMRVDNISVPETLNVSKLYPATTDHELRVTAAMFSAIGGGTLTLDAAATSPAEIYIRDTGPTVAVAGTVY